MIRKMLFAAALTATAVLSAAVRDFRNFERDGKPVLIPAVQKYDAAAGVYKLPAKLTVTAPASLDFAPLAKVYALTIPGGTVERGENGVCRFELTSRGVPNSQEGYTLGITDKLISVRARDVRGLYYGMQTLNMLLRHRVDAGTLKC